MGLWKLLFGGNRSDKDDLIRRLVKQRVRTDPVAAEVGFDESMVDSIGPMELAGIPEGTIVAIVETYALLRKQGVSDREIFERIENHRSAIGTGEMHSPLNLDSYIRYRIDIEHDQGKRISDEFLKNAIDTCREHYKC